MNVYILQLILNNLMKEELLISFKNMIKEGCENQSHC